MAIRGDIFAEFEVTKDRAQIKHRLAPIDRGLLGLLVPRGERIMIAAAIHEVVDHDAVDLLVLDRLADPIDRGIPRVWVT